ncbi:uncharacterized protein [Aquarana catesbeiana]|uniref:uncharacterized protein n=1 Tax=Aquarana catesbeiana TaxID=8400 RepID=UPI003CCA51C1
MHDLQSICLLLDLILMLRGALCSGLSPDCTPNVNLPKNAKAGQTQNQPLSLRCPVTLCSLDEPTVTWCRVERRGNSQCEIVKPDDRISSGWGEKTENEAVHVLKFQFVQLNDTGFYQCLAVFKGMQIVGSVIKVTVPGLHSDCTPNINLPKNSKAGQTQNQPLSLRCPVRLCSHDEPIVTWCRVERRGNSQCEIVKPDDRISSGWGEKTENEAVHFLKFQFVHLNDTGFYQCLATFKEMQIVGSAIEVTVLAQPSVTLEINCAGIPECTAHGAYPAADISWTPQTDKITTEHFQHDNKTWTSISRYNLKNVTMVTCRVSHPTFTSPQEKSIILNGTEGKHFSWKIPAYIIFLVITFTLFIFMKIKTKTICCQKKSGEHHHTKVIEIPPTSEEAIDPRSLQPIHEASPEDNNPFQAGDLM